MESNRGRVISFYSYKGGTGRSMAVANTACLLSRRADVRRGVLVIDWDLEAPGVHWFFPKDAGGHPEERFALQHDGLVELISDLASRLRGISDSPLTEEMTERIVGEVSLDRFVVETGVRKVHLMPAGQFSSDYADRVSTLNWRELFYLAPSVIRIFAEFVAHTYDYVLIDSRTGLNDISGVCTALLPDQLVLVFTPNRQSLIGGIDAVKKAVRYRSESEDIRPLTVFPLPSRIDVSEPELLEKWRFGDSRRQEDEQGYQNRFETLFKDVYNLASCDLKNYFDEIQIQHVPRYSYGEEIAALVERGTRLSVSRSYATFADILSMGEPPWSVPLAVQGGAELVAGAAPSLAKVQAAKEYLSEDRFRLKLHDLVTTEARDVTKQTQQFSPHGDATGEAFAERLRSYEAAVHDLLLIQALLGYWGDENHQHLLGIGPKQVCGQIESASGLVLYLAARWYPALLLLYSGGIAAIMGQRYANLFTLISTPVKAVKDSSNLNEALILTTAESMLELDRIHAFKLLPGLDRHYTPRSDYLYDLLRPLITDLLSLGFEYEGAFDRFEILYALQHAHLYERFREFAPRFWGPIGRFGWKRKAFDQVIREAEERRELWGPIRAGLFDGSFDRFNEVASGFQEGLQQLRWF